MDPSLVDWAHLEQKHFESLHNIEDNVSTNLKLYQMMVQLAPPNMKIVWIAAPRNREWESTLSAGQYPVTYKTALDELTTWSSRSVIVLDSDLDSRHYLDHGHIVTAVGRRICTDRLLYAVKELTREMQ